MRNVVLTSCGIINDDFKEKFYIILNGKDISTLKVLYITTASDGETDVDKTWMDEEYKKILNMGFKDENITEYKIGNPLDINEFDVIYMMGGNTFYLLDMIRKYEFNKVINSFINDGKIYIGSSAGSEILGNSIEPAIGYDENNANMTDFTGLRIVNGLVIPHCNRKQEYISKLKSTTSEELYLLYDGDGIIIK